MFITGPRNERDVHVLLRQEPRIIEDQLPTKDECVRRAREDLHEEGVREGGDGVSDGAEESRGKEFEKQC